MAITATLKRKEARRDGTVHIVVVTSDPPRGDTTHERTFPAAEATGANVLAWVNQLVFSGIEAAQAAVAALPAEEFSLTLTPPTPPSPPTPAEVTRAAWLVEYRRLQRANQLMADGVIEPTNPQLVALKATVVAGFLPTYVDFV